MLRERYLTMPWTKPITNRTIRKGLAMPVSQAFPLDWEPEPADFLEMEANMLEAAAYLIRHRDGQLKAHATLSGLTAFAPNGGRKSLGEMSATDLELTVEHLREKASRKRALAQLESEMQV